MPELKTLAIPLRKVDFSETSQVLRFLTRDYGKITAIARGAKRRKGSFPGAFDLLIEYEIVRLPKPEERLDVLTAGVAVREFPALRSDLDAYYAACYAAELVDELTPESQPAVEVYDLLTGFLEELQGGAPLPLALFRFEAALLRERGFFPRLLECGACRRRISQPDAWFSPRDGGAVCVLCRTRDPGAYRVAARVLYAAGNLLSRERLPEALYRDLADDLRRLLDEHIRHVAERNLKSARFAREVCRKRQPAAEDATPRLRPSPPPRPSPQGRPPPASPGS
jgi:DNA repair protein RecO (recombination protein O)